MDPKLVVIAAAVVIIAAAALRRGLETRDRSYSLLEVLKNLAKAFRGLLSDGRELILFALFEVVAIAATALSLLVFGVQASFYVLIGAVVAFYLWATKPPAKKR